MPGTTAAVRPDVRALRAAVYRPGATADDIAALERALAELAERRAPAAEPAAPAAPEAATDPRPEAVRPRPGRSRGRRVAALAVAAATAAGCAGGVTLVSLVRPPSESAAVVPTAIHIGTTAGDGVFARAQRPSDRPTVELDPALVPGSVRRLLSAGRIQLYAAQDRTGRRCLVGVQTGTVRSCVTPDRFRRSGLRILWTSDVLANDPAGLREARYRLALAADWRPDGRVVLGAIRG